MGVGPDGEPVPDGEPLGDPDPDPDPERTARDGVPSTTLPLHPAASRATAPTATTMPARRRRIRVPSR
ncbi:hypothetical protein GCM10027265_02390 [Jatrophihabitans fulvus]